MEDIHLPFKLRWAGEPTPDLQGFSEPLAIPFWLRPIAEPQDAETAGSDGK